MKTRHARASDLERLAAMRAALWPDDTAEGHAELAQILAGAWPGVYPFAIFVAETDDGDVVGFADVTLRSYADGCDPSHAVGYLEGWFVDEAHRRKGIGAALLRAGEEWSRAQDCTEMASDTWLDNEGSQRAHEALGFEVVDRVVTFRKSLVALLLALTFTANADVVLHNVTVIDGSGRFVIPGLVDMHVHVLTHPWTKREPPAALRPRGQSGHARAAAAAWRGAGADPEDLREALPAVPS